MPLGLCNAPATFERLMEAVWEGLSWDICLVYLDDIIVHTRSFDQHLMNLKCVLDRLRQANLMLKPAKCTLFQTAVTYLGYVVSERGVTADPVKVQALMNWPRPSNTHEVRSFIGLCSYYHRFVPGFAQLAKPLHPLTEKNANFKWTEECDKAFQTLKDHLTKAPVLAYPDFVKPFILDTDASDVAIGATLSQIVDGEEHPMSYFSRTLTGPEKQYCVTRRELLAVIHAASHFHPYLYGNQFAIHTDHTSLQWLLNFKNPEGQMARWLQKLQQYNFIIHHYRGRLDGNADALSRPCEETACKYCEKREVRDADVIVTNGSTIGHKESTVLNVLCETISNQDEETRITEAQNQDPEIRVILQLMQESTNKPSLQEVAPYSVAVKTYWGQWQSLKNVVQIFG